MVKQSFPHSLDRLCLCRLAKMWRLLALPAGRVGCPAFRVKKGGFILKFSCPLRLRLGRLLLCSREPLATCSAPAACAQNSPLTRKPACYCLAQPQAWPCLLLSLAAFPGRAGPALQYSLLRRVWALRLETWAALAVASTCCASRWLPALPVPAQLARD